MALIGQITIALFAIVGLIVAAYWLDQWWFGVPAP